MHESNIHKDGYDFKVLLEYHADLKPFVFQNEYGNQTIDFSNAEAVFALNKALLLAHYRIADWHIPKGFLCPPIPGRADYIHHINDLIEDRNNVKGLDVGVGANCIYPIIASQHYGWQMVGSDINEESIKYANQNVSATEGLSDLIEIRYQENRGLILKGIIQQNEFFTFTMCNPPFFASEEDALKASARKNQNLHQQDKGLNFGGQATELYCNGGEALFIKRLIKESAHFKNQVGWFTTLVSQSNNLPKLTKQLKKLKATLKVIPMAQGQKQSRILAWQF